MRATRPPSGLSSGSRSPLARSRTQCVSWYVGATKQLHYTLVNPMRSQGVESEILFVGDDPMEELIDLVPIV